MMPDVSVRRSNPLSAPLQVLYVAQHGALHGAPRGADAAKVTAALGFAGGQCWSNADGDAQGGHVMNLQSTQAVKPLWLTPSPKAF